MSNIFESRLVSVGVYAYLGRDTCVPRSGYMRTSVGVHVYLGRGTCVPRSGYDDNKASLTRQTQCFYKTTAIVFIKQQPCFH